MTTEEVKLTPAELAYQHILKGSKKYYQKNKEALKQKQRIYRANMTQEQYENTLLKNREWKKNHKEQANQKNRESYRRRMEAKKETDIQNV